MTSEAFIAIDLGAASGRLMMGFLDDKRLRLDEIHRFPNNGVFIGDSLHWDVLRIWDQILIGLQIAHDKYTQPIYSIGLDTWGVDFGLLAKDDNLIGNPYHYRDRRTKGVFPSAFSLVPKAEIYAQTGIQFIEFNSLFQLLTMAQTHAPQLAIAHTFLNMPDLFNFFLTGRKINEFTIATTTQCYNPLLKQWCFDLINKFGIPTNLFGEIVPPGVVLGNLRSSLSQKFSLPQLPVVACAGHDTACAVAAVPSVDTNHIYISSGTWSLMGIELNQPIISPISLCKRKWNQQGKQYNYDDLTKLAANSPALKSFIAVNAKRFLAPDDMPTEIQAYCQETGQIVPENKGAIIRCVLESLALEYRMVAEQIDRIVGKRFPVIHIVGGGSKNQLLNQFVADATGRAVLAGPVEATVIGNILVQAKALAAISSLVEGRKIVNDSFDIVLYEPAETQAWEEAYMRFLNLE